MAHTDRRTSMDTDAWISAGTHYIEWYASDRHDAPDPVVHARFRKDAHDFERRHGDVTGGLTYGTEDDYRDLLDSMFHDGRYTWGRFVAVHVFTAQWARKNPSNACDFVEMLAKYARDNRDRWTLDNHPVACRIM